jgi:hypothetical protein
MNLSITTIGLPETKALLSAKAGLALKASISAINWACAKIMSETREAISVAGPPASQPGDFPRRESGDLLRSIGIGKMETSLTKISRSVGANPDSEDIGYAMYLEFGTSRISPRPYLSVITEKNRDSILNNFASEIKKIC